MCKGNMKVGKTDQMENGILPLDKNTESSCE